MADTTHVHHFVPTPTGRYTKYTEWVDGKPVPRTEPIRELKCTCGAIPLFRGTGS